jgi:Na+/alanine symporter
LLLCAFFFAITSLFSYSYYGSKALAFLIGVKASRYYDYFYLSTIIIGAVASMTDVMNVIDIAYALMALPTMISGFILAPKVLAEARSSKKWSFGRRRRTEAPTSSVNRPTAASTKYIVRGVAIGASETVNT